MGDLAATLNFFERGGKELNPFLVRTFVWLGRCSTVLHRFPQSLDRGVVVVGERMVGLARRLRTVLAGL
jgi:hypothetical protein